MTGRQPAGGWIPALGLAVGVAQAGARLLAPRGGPPRAEAVLAAEFFSAEEIARSRAYARPQLMLGAASTLVQAGLVGLLAWWRGGGGGDRRGRGGERRGDRRQAGPVAAAAAGAGLSIGLRAATLPLAGVMRKRALDAGLATQSWGGWAGDVAKSSSIGAALAGAGAPVVISLMRRRGERWWVEAAAGSVALGVLFTTVAPVVLDPIFNRFTRLGPGELRDDVLELARRAGVGVQDVYTVDASRRTTAANAYVTGLGATRRVVLFDTLTATFGRDETRLVVAHELAHVRHRDVRRALAQMALAAPASMLAVARLTRRLDRAPELGPGPGLLPALILAAGIIAGPIGVVSNQLSRAVERRADAFALELTDAPGAFTSFERRIVLANLADPDPPSWFNALLATHPPVVERIGIARAHDLRSGGAPGREPRVVPAQDPLLGA